MGNFAKKDAWRYHEIDWLQKNIPVARQVTSTGLTQTTLKTNPNTLFFNSKYQLAWEELLDSGTTATFSMLCCSIPCIISNHQRTLLSK